MTVPFWKVCWNNRLEGILSVVLTGLPCHDLAPPSVVNISALVLGRVVSPLAVFMIAASSWRTLLCLYVYRPCERAILQERNTCSVVCLPWHSGQVGSSFFPHRTRFAFEGRRSYTDLMRKLIRCGAMCQISFHVRDFCRALSQLVHCPCWGCWTAFCTFLESSLSRISLMTMSLFSFPSAFDHHFAVDDPSPLRSVWVCPITSLILRHSLASSTASTTFHFLPVFMVGCTVFTTGSSESSNIESSLALPYLYSSKMDLSFALRQYIATSVPLTTSWWTYWS